jgi:hypothetical protein
VTMTISICELLTTVTYSHQQNVEYWKHETRR